MERILTEINEVVQNATVQARGSSLKQRKKRDPTRPAARWVTEWVEKEELLLPLFSLP